MTVKELFLIAFGIEADLPEEILNEEAVSCSGSPYFLEFFEFETVPFPKLCGFNLSISTEKHEVKLKLEFDKISELSINDVKPGKPDNIPVTGSLPDDVGVAVYPTENNNGG